MRATLIDREGLVVNVVLVGDGYMPPDGLALGPDGGQIGWRWDGARYVSPPLPPPAPPTADDVRAEAQRRIIALVGASDITSCLIKQLNANMRANELNDIQHSRALTSEETAEVDALRSLATQIKSIRASSNVLEPNPPSDFADDKYWPA